MGLLVTMRPASAGAAARPDTMYVVAPIVVEATRVDRPPDLFNRSGFVARIDLTARADRVEDLGTVLAQSVGVRVKEYGGLGGYATLSIRGSSSNQVRLYIDGIPVDDAYAGSLDLSMFPTGGVDGVEVYRGFAPAGLGPAAIGGAINVVTTDPRVLRGGGWLSRVQASESYGSYDTSRHRLSLWSNPPGVDLFVHGGYSRSLGDFDFDDDNGTPFAPNDDEVSTRANNDSDAWNLLARAAADLGGVATLRAGHDMYRRDHGVPGIGVNQSPTARSRARRRLSHLRIDTTALPGGLGLNAMTFYGKTVEQFTDLDGDVALGRQDTDNTALSYGGRVGATWKLPVAPVTLGVVFDGRKEQFHPVNKVPALVAGPDRWRRAHTVAVSGEFSPFTERLVLSATYRREDHRNEFFDAPAFPWLPPSPQGRQSFTKETPGAGARWHVTPYLTVKGNVGRYYRLPTFLELFGNSGSVTGNADLVPEYGLNRDVGVVLMSRRVGPVRRAFLEVVYLDNEVDDLILYFPNSQRSAKPRNIGSATIRGWEASASASVAAYDFGVNYTYLDTEDTSDIPYYAGNDLPSRPQHDLFTSASGTWRGWKLTWEFHHIGANYLDQANLDEAPRRNLHNVTLQTGLPVPGFTFTVEARNVTDERVEDVSGYPLPGRSFFTTLSYRFTPAGG